MREFKLGDAVISDIDGSGIVIALIENKINSVKVRHLECIRTYTKEGTLVSGIYNQYSIKHIENIKENKGNTMKCTTQAEVFEQLARVSRMLENTTLRLSDLVKYDMEKCYGLNLDDDPTKFTFALALVEGKPVFAGDILYNKCANLPITIYELVAKNVLIGTTESEDINYVDRVRVHTSVLTWEFIKKTFTLNGVDLSKFDEIILNDIIFVRK